MQGRDGDSASRPKRLTARHGKLWPAIALAASAVYANAAGSQSGQADAAPFSTNSQPVPPAPALPSAGRWTVYAGDSLASLARGIHPRDRARQTQYIAAIRSLNPEIAMLANDALMPVGLQLTLPDLKALSGLPANSIALPVAEHATVRAAAAQPGTGEPNVSPIVVQANAAPVKTTPPTPSPAALPGQWTVRTGDTMRKLAQAIYPASRARQDLYVGELRSLNPHLADTSDGDALEADALLVMPDLKKLSALPAEPAQAVADLPRPARPAPMPQPAAPKRAPAPKPAVATPIAPAPAARSSASAPASAAASQPTGAGLRLRLSGTDINLSRSRTISESDRRALREKQLLLDADDQLAALLSLRNTVRQLESRLSELQLKMASGVNVAGDIKPASAAPQSPPAAMPAVPAQESATAANSPVAPQAPQTPPAAAASAGKTATATPAAVPPGTISPGDDSMARLASGPVLGALGAGLLALLGLFAWWRARRTPAALDTQMARAMPASEPMPAPPPAGEDAEYDALLTKPGEAATDLRQFQSIRDANTGGTGPATVTHDVFDIGQQSDDVTAKLDNPVNLADSPAHFDLDVAPATTVDLLVGMDDRPGEDRVRRLQYMYERYPELMTHTVSIDDADSVINAARLYYEEDQHDKACELLTFGVEERPQETRFWLAQFEIFRLENMAHEFTELASKFHVLFGHTAAWPKVRHIGHELDPGNTLFAAAGREALAGEMHFDPVAENWLNAPMDFTSDALVAELRLALFDDHGVDRRDFELITARLAAGAGPTTGTAS